jgi:UDP-N-acetylglucosamine 2-epimerase (non-hydrolysing)
MFVCNVVGARPNFMKIAPIAHELKQRNIRQMLVHTGQHYDANMSRVFFDELNLPSPDLYLGVGSDSHARQTARVMTAFEEVCQEHHPDLIIVSGDVNSTLAVALVASKLSIPVAHVESGLRSFDRAMPEEINRVVTDHLSNLLFTTEDSANQNLVREGIAEHRIHFVGNCMVDTLLKHVDTAIHHSPWQTFQLETYNYALLTLHRPANVDEVNTLNTVVDILNETAERLPVIFPIHPRTQERLKQGSFLLNSRIIMCEPLPYLTFLGLMARAKCVITDSGGIQEETTALNIPCLTMRSNTERPITITQGTNKLVGLDRNKIQQNLSMILANDWPLGIRPPLWDGKAGQRIVDVVQDWRG